MASKLGWLEKFILGKNAESFLFFLQNKDIIQQLPSDFNTFTNELTGIIKAMKPANQKDSVNKIVTTTIAFREKYNVLFAKITNVFK